jgi:Ala-tRNA(Pro) deacylase
MSIAPTLAKYLDQNVAYDVVSHAPTMSSMRTAEACHIPGNCLAKAVVLRSDGRYLLAVLSASRRVGLTELKAQLGPGVELAEEDEIGRLFQDCARGAVPPVGECYGLDMIIDESVDRQPEIYFEAGDHMTLVHMTRAQFALLTAEARHLQRARLTATTGIDDPIP